MKFICFWGGTKRTWGKFSTKKRGVNFQQTKHGVNFQQKEMPNWGGGGSEGSLAKDHIIQTKYKRNGNEIQTYKRNGNEIQTKYKNLYL